MKIITTNANLDRLVLWLDEVVLFSSNGDQATATKEAAAAITALRQRIDEIEEHDRFALAVINQAKALPAALARAERAEKELADAHGVAQANERRAIAAEDEAKALRWRVDHCILAAEDLRIAVAEKSPA